MAGIGIDGKCVISRQLEVNNRNMTWIETLHDTAVGGIEFDLLEGWGGVECKNYSSLHRRLIESLMALVLSFLSIVISKRLSIRKKTHDVLCNGNNNLQNGHVRRENEVDEYSETLRTTVLFVYTLVNGIELGYKVIR